jgi:hypothetical protein
VPRIRPERVFNSLTEDYRPEKTGYFTAKRGRTEDSILLGTMAHS